MANALCLAVSTVVLTTRVQVSSRDQLHEVGRGLALVVVREAAGAAGHPKRVWWVPILPLILSIPSFPPSLKDPFCSEICPQHSPCSSGQLTPHSSSREGSGETQPARS